MSRRSSDPSSGLLVQVFSTVIAWTYFYIPIGLGYCTGACFYPAKGSLTRLLRLKQCSRFWHTWSGSCHFLQGVGGLLFTAGLWAIVWEFPILQVRPDTLKHIGGGVFFALWGGLLCSVMHWLRGYGRDPAVQREVAGWRAEAFVVTLLERARRLHLDWQLWHGVLLVFEEGTSDEFSVEVDHLLVTASQVFVIETKWKSGTIVAHPTAAQWQVCTPHGNGTMRNALIQAKQTARVLRQQWQLDAPVIPLVAIHGQSTRIVEGPGNVVVAEDILQVLQAFDSAPSEHHSTPTGLAAHLHRHRRTSQQAMRAHIARAQQAQLKAEKKHYVDTASLN